MNNSENSPEGPKTFEEHVLDVLPDILNPPQGGWQGPQPAGGAQPREKINLPQMVREDRRLQHTDVTPPQKPPKNIDNYSFTPITRLDGVTGTFLDGADYNLNPDIQTHFEGYVDARPFLDGPAAIGIVVEREGQSHLAAVASATLESNGTIVVEQLQGVIKPSSGMGPQLGGFRWAETLMNAWQKVAELAGANALQLVASDDFIDDWRRREAAKGDEYAQRIIASYERHYDKTAANLGLRAGQSKSGKKVYHRAIDPKPLDTSIAGMDRSIGGVRRELRQAINMFDAGRHSTRSALLNARRLLVDATFELTSVQDYRRELPHIVNNPDYERALTNFQTTIEKIDEQLNAMHEAAEIARRYEQTL